MKIAIAGKGGVGKTTVCALLAREFSRTRRRVLAVDADPDANLAAALGFPEAGSIRPIAELKELIRERAGDGSGLVRLNPRVDDIPESHSAVHDGIRLIVLGGIARAGGGCACPANVFLKELLGHLLTEPDGVVLADMEAGIEHLGRATAESVDLFVIVTEPSRTSVESARKIAALAADLGIEKIALILNKLRDDGERRMPEAELRDYTCIGRIPYSERLRESSIEKGAVGEDPAVRRAIEEIARTIIEE